MMKKLTVLIILLLGPVGLRTMAQNEFPRERLYVQTDKPGYLAGELIWFKIISTDQLLRPLTISSIAYVELTPVAGTPIRTKVKLASGVGTGSLEVPVDLPSGNYTLVAYTRYMLNEGSEVFTRKQIPVLNTFTGGGNVVMITDLSQERLTEDPEESGGANLTITINGTQFSPGQEISFSACGFTGDHRTLSLCVSGMDPFAGPQANIGHWSEVINTGTVGSFSGNFVPEYNGVLIEGELLDRRSGRPEPDAQVVPFLGMIGDQMRVFGGMNDGTGKLTFHVGEIWGDREVATAVFADNDQYVVEILPAFVSLPPVENPPLALNTNWNEYLTSRSVGLQLLNSYYRDILTHTSNQQQAEGMKPDKIYRIDEYTVFPTFAEAVKEYMQYLRFRTVDGRQTLTVLVPDRIEYRVSSPLVVIDGVPLNDMSVLAAIDPRELETVSVFRDKYIIGGQMFDGLVSVKSKKGNYPGIEKVPSVRIFDFEGIAPEREFYGNKTGQATMPDPRHTLVWEPEISDRIHEGAFTDTFTASEIPGEYLLRIEGLTVDGSPVYGEQRFIVK